MPLMPTLNDLDLLARESLFGDRSTRSSLSSRAPAQGRALSAVGVTPILIRRELRATVVSDTAWEEEVITDAAFEGFGPHLEDLIMHAETHRRTGQHEWRVAIQRKFMDLDWTPTSANIQTGDLVLPVQNSEVYTVGSPFADRGRLGARIRLLLQWHTKTSGSGAIGDMAEISLAMAGRRWS